MWWTYDNEVSFLFRTQLQEKLPTIDKLCSSKLVKFERTQFIFSNVFIAIIIIVCSHVSSLLLALPALSFLGGGGGVQVQAVSTSSTCRFTPYPGWVFLENIENTISKPQDFQNFLGWMPPDHSSVAAIPVFWMHWVHSCYLSENYLPYGVHFFRVHGEVSLS